MRSKSGFTLIELLVVLAIMGIMAAIATPEVIRWVKEDGVRSAAKQIYADMQFTKISAIKENTKWAMWFDTTNHKYYIFSDDGTDDDWTVIDGDSSQPIVKEVVLTNPDKFKGNVDYGHGNATSDATDDAGGFPGDDVGYSSVDDGTNVLVFNSRGIPTAGEGTTGEGFVYIDNEYDTTYAIGTRSSGVIMIKKWNGSSWD